MQMDFDICESIRIHQIITGTDSIGQLHSLNFVKIRIHQIITWFYSTVAEDVLMGDADPNAKSPIAKSGRDLHQSNLEFAFPYWIELLNKIS